MQNKILIITILFILSFGLSACSKQVSSPTVSEYAAYVHSSADSGSGKKESSLKNIQSMQPTDKGNAVITKHITKRTVLIDLAIIGAGMINECMYNQERILSVDFNNLSLPTKLYDIQGNLKNSCDYNVDNRKKLEEICEYLEKCKLVYVSPNNIRGYNPVDKYGIEVEIEKMK